MKIRHLDWEFNEAVDCYEATIYGSVGWISAVIFKDENGKWNLNYEGKYPSENILKTETLEGAIQAAYMLHKKNVINDFGDKNK